MRRSLTALIAICVCIPVAWLAFGLPLPGTSQPIARTLLVPAGDAELAWMHTTTNAATWERFVKGIKQAAISVNDLTIDDSAAFPNDTLAIPEVVIRKANRNGAIRIRWYKLSNEANISDWMKMLARRDVQPLAIIGGGSSDRAAELARAMAAESEWDERKPLLFITTASAEKVLKDPNSPDAGEIALTKIYPERTFRFCFSNRQMAAASVDFLWSQTELRPKATAGKPKGIVLHWDDDPFSKDLRDQFRAILFSRTDLIRMNDTLPFSIGGANSANRYERRAAEFVSSALTDDPQQRALLVLPTVTNPARRVLRAICELEPTARERLVVVNGDGIPMNAIYRDGRYLWPVDQLPVPIVIFSHANPFGWDGTLKPATSTEDVLHFATIATMSIDAAFGDDDLAKDANEFRSRLQVRHPNTFDDDGNRLGGTGEFVAVIHPRTTIQPPRIAVWRHTDRWSLINTLELPLSRGVGE